MSPQQRALDWRARTHGRASGGAEPKPKPAGLSLGARGDRVEWTSHGPPHGPLPDLTDGRCTELGERAKGQELSCGRDSGLAMETVSRPVKRQIGANLVIHFTLVMNQAILGLALLAAKTESVERRFSKTSGGGSLNGLPASKLAASICSVSAGQRGSFVRTARPRRVGRPDEARCSVAGADARPLPRREPSCTTRGCRCGVGSWPCGWPALRKQG